MAENQQKKSWEMDSVPFDVRPGSEVPFELSQVGHGEFLFGVEAEVERSKIGIWLGLGVCLATARKAVFIIIAPWSRAERSDHKTLQSLT